MPAGPAVLPWSLSRRKMGLNSSPAFPNHSLSHPRALGGVPAVPRGDQQQQLPVPSVKHGAADAKTMSECEMHVWMVALLQPLAESLLECRGRSAVCLLPSLPSGSAVECCALHPVHTFKGQAAGGSAAWWRPSRGGVVLGGSGLRPQGYVGVLRAPGRVPPPRPPRLVLV